MVRKIWHVNVFKDGKNIVETEAESETAAIDKAAQLLVKQGFEWDGLPVALGVILKDQPRITISNITATISCQ